MAQEVRIVSQREEQLKAELSVFLVVIIAVLFALKWAWDTVVRWQYLELPFNYFAASYYYVIVLPLKGFTYLWHWVDDQALTIYPNLNHCIGALSLLVYGVFLIYIVVGIRFIFNKIGIRKKRYQIGIVLAPAIFSCVWYVVSVVFFWLFATQ